MIFIWCKSETKVLGGVKHYTSHKNENKCLQKQILNNLVIKLNFAHEGLMNNQRKLMFTNKNLWTCELDFQANAQSVIYIAESLPDLVLNKKKIK